MRFILLVASVLAAGCAGLKHGEWSDAPLPDSKDPRECRLLYRRDWSNIWLECRTCFNSKVGHKVECPR